MTATMCTSQPSVVGIERCRFGEVVAKPSISGEASGLGVEICMYGFRGEGYSTNMYPDDTYY
jgi:hypothetical protein